MLEGATYDFPLFGVVSGTYCTTAQNVNTSQLQYLKKSEADANLCISVYINCHTLLSNFNACVELKMSHWYKVCCKDWSNNVETLAVTIFRLPNTLFISFISFYLFEKENTVIILRNPQIAELIEAGCAFKSNVIISKKWNKRNRKEISEQLQ